MGMEDSPDSDNDDPVGHKEPGFAAFKDEPANGQEEAKQWVQFERSPLYKTTTLAAYNDRFSIDY